MTSHKPVRLLTPKEAADFLSVSARTIKRLVSEGKPSCRSSSELYAL